MNLSPGGDTPLIRPLKVENNSHDSMLIARTQDEAGQSIDLLPGSHVLKWLQSLLLPMDSQYPSTLASGAFMTCKAFRKCVFVSSIDM